jgi:hypothetical protein
MVIEDLPKPVLGDQVNVVREPIAYLANSNKKLLRRRHAEIAGRSRYDFPASIESDQGQLKAGNWSTGGKMTSDYFLKCLAYSTHHKSKRWSLIVEKFYQLRQL